MSTAGDQAENNQEVGNMADSSDNPPAAAESPMGDSGVFIVGANGQLGTALRAQYPNTKFADIDELDITNRQSVEEFDWSGTQVIINAAAYTDVDGAESPAGRPLAWAVNADAVANLVTVAAQHNATLVHISTDYVFDGSLSLHDENEAFAPLNTYGASKAAGDLIVSLAPKFFILRTSWVIGEGKNFVRTMLSLGRKGVSPAVVSDQIGRLTFTGELVRAIDHLLGKNAPYGTYNVSNDGEPASWADITRKIFELAEISGTVADITTDEYYAGKEGIAQRPLQSTLNLAKLHSTGFKSRNWVDDLKEYIQKELKK